MLALVVRVLPVGNYNDGSFNNVGSYAYFWSATENNSNNAYNRNFDTSDTMNQNTNNKDNGFSVRLVKDTSGREKLNADSLFFLLYPAYRNARRNKRNTRSQLRFEASLEHNLRELAYSLEHRTYVPLPSSCFIHDGFVFRYLRGCSSMILTVVGKGKVRCSV